MSKPFRLMMDEDRIVRGDYFAARTQPAVATVVLCHGFKGFKDWGMFPHAAAELADTFDVITINFSYNGVGEGLLDFTELEKFAVQTYSRDLEDLGTVVRLIRSGAFRSHFVQNQVVEGIVEFQKAQIEEQDEQIVHVNEEAREALFLIGHSRGAGVCYIYALDHPGEIDGVISWNGISDVDLLNEEMKKEMRNSGRAFTYNGRTKQNMPLDVEILQDMEANRERFDLQARIVGASFPIVLIQGTEDGRFLREGSERLVALNPEIEWIHIQGGNHTFGTVHPFQGETEPLREALQKTRLAITRILSSQI
ncbi:alpha/beta hydrolase family protein [Paenibacillus eucommiae]|uniref:Pimeloyl-ACP methyl ester carboxylesterase n=1 Tax=Paenibacillus eucommiae TaxID=1355755 RepID=A0ABS4IYT6_9BACL|nr:alpha/beta fold hydrolase [Paenibacillus eucommiae]MBP1992754.1 pimeloyl-ACP methyl ester carboxylesterase [Paenibacillus eucommiae]